MQSLLSRLESFTLVYSVSTDTAIAALWDAFGASKAPIKHAVRMVEMPHGLGFL